MSGATPYLTAMKLFTRNRSSKPEFSAPLLPDEPFFAIGDLHGRVDLLRHAIACMQEVAPDITKVFVGDYIDRGEDSAGTLSLLLDYQQASDERVICLKGNHEQMLQLFLEDPAAEGRWWLGHGGLQTMASYGVRPPQSTASAAKWLEARDQLKEAMGERVLTWLADLPVRWQSGNIAVVHAAINPDKPMNEQDVQEMLWGHPDFGRKPRSDGNWVVHGHTIVDEPVLKNGCIPIDTGGYATGHLTAALFLKGSVEFFST
ncbi:serine/threonine protein phosphatase [Ferrimonas balearica]|nr:serine/threonine protein phosphatase [Ferrimonas balearica]